MTKNLLITIYILTVLLVSVIARADFSSFDNSMDEVIAVNNDFKLLPVPPVKFEEVMKADGEITLPIQTDIFEGRIVFVGNGDYVLVIDENTFFYLNSHADLSAFVGYNVVINGILQNFKPADIQSPTVLDPLPDMGNEIEAPSVYVIGISVK